MPTIVLAQSLGHGIDLRSSALAEPVAPETGRASGTQQSASCRAPGLRHQAALFALSAKSAALAKIPLHMKSEAPPVVSAGPARRAGRAPGSARRFRRSDRQPASRACRHAGRSLGLGLRARRGRARAARPGPLVVVWPHIDDLDDFCDDLALVQHVCRRAVSGLGGEAQRAGRLRRDLRRATAAAQALSAPGTRPPRAIVTSIQSLLQGVPARAILDRRHGDWATASRVDVQAVSGLAGRERLSSHQRRRTAGRVLRAGRHSGHLRARLVRPGANRVLRRPGRVDPPLRSGHAAQPGDARRRSTSRCSIAATTTASTLPATCRRDVGFCLSSRAIWKKRGGIIWSGSSGRRIFTASRARCGRSRGFASVTAAERAASASLETTCHLRIESVERFSGDIAKVRDELDPWRGRPAGQEVFVVCQTEAERSGCKRFSATTRLAAAGKLHFPMRPTRSRLSAGARADRAGQRQRAVSSRGSEPALAPPAGPRHR